MPGIPDVELDPNLVLLVFLPPLLYSAAFFADLRALRADARVISLSAVGLVLATTAVVAVIGHELMDLPWAMAFALGAIVSPTDPAAATAIMRRVGAPRRMVNILEGESLFNDATALVAYKVAVAAAVGESVSAGHTVLEFFARSRRRDRDRARRRLRHRPRSAGASTDINTELTISLFSAYGAFIPADQLGVSGVLAVVDLRRLPRLPRARDRLAGEPDAGLRAVVDPHVPAQRRAVHPHRAAAADRSSTGSQRPPGGRGRRLRGGRLRGGDRGALRLELLVTIAHPRHRPAAVAGRAARRAGETRVVGGWAGMRGAVSLAAALALPLQTDAGDPLPGRELIQFVTFALILVTVVGQGLTLPVADPPPRARSTTATRRSARSCAPGS